MVKKYLWLIFVSFLLTACRSNEPKLDLFHLTLGTTSDAEVAMGIHSAEVTINGYTRVIDVGVVGDFDYYTISDNIPEWISVSYSTTLPNRFEINVAAIDNSDSRIGKIGLTVFKGSKSQKGEITIIQNPCTLEDLKKTEQRAMKKYLSKFDVIDNLPAINDIQVGSVAPFYKLTPEGTVYMQVVKKGIGPSATNGEQIYFRYLRYNLLSYLENGKLPIGQGNLNSLTQDVTFFTLGSDDLNTTQWGPAIQMPLLLGLPLDSEVNLVVASEAGFSSEISSVTPFLYNVVYFNSEN